MIKLEKEIFYFFKKRCDLVILSYVFMIGGTNEEFPCGAV